MQAVSAQAGFSTVPQVREDFEYVAGCSAPMRLLHDALTKVAASDVPVLIIGEPGSGKRAIARRIHQLSGSSTALYELNCHGLQPDVLVEAASNGPACTVVLTDMASLSAAGQLRLLQELTKSDRNGGSRSKRMIICSEPSLEQEIAAGRFREDLYYRTSSVCLRVPPLRQRKEDIPLLADFFLDKYSKLLGRTKPVLSPAMLRFLTEYAWPGNVAELQDAAKTIAAVGDERVAMAALHAALFNGRAGRRQTRPVSLKDAARAASRQAERELILEVLSRTRWNRKKAAEELRISYKALLYKLKQIGVGDDAESAFRGDRV